MFLSRRFQWWTDKVRQRRPNAARGGQGQDTERLKMGELIAKERRWKSDTAGPRFVKVNLN